MGFLIPQKDFISKRGPCNPWLQDATIISLLGQIDVATSFGRKNDVSNASCVHWGYITLHPPSAAHMRRGTRSSGNDLLPVRRQATTRTNAGLLSIGLLGTNFSEIWIGILPFSVKKIHFKMSSAKMATIFPRGDELPDSSWRRLQPTQCRREPLRSR